MDTALVIELSLILLGAFVGGVIAAKLRQPLVVGYILAGLILGAFIPSVRDSSEAVYILAEIGVALLLFTLGLEFSIDRLKKVGKPAVLGALIQLFAVIIIMAGILYAFKMPLNVAVFIGAVVSLSSTAVAAKILSEKGELDSSHGELIMAWLVVQDIAVVPIMIILPVLTTGGAFELIPFLLSVAKVLIALYLIFILGRKTVPYVFKKLALYDNRELLLVSAFLFCISVAIFASYFGLSFAVGAFLAGVLLSTTAVNHEVFTEIRPLRDVFASIFFVSLGFLINVAGVFTILGLALAIAFTIIMVKLVVIFCIAVFFNYHSKIAFLTAFALFEIGEFGFILAKVGFDSKILDQHIYQSLILASILTLVFTPLLYNFSPKMYTLFKRYSKSYAHIIYSFIFTKLDSDAKMPRPRTLKLKDHVIIVGYGRVGRYITSLLDKSSVSYCVVDVHYKTLQDLRKRGVISIYGDAVNKDVLNVAGIKDAKGIIIATPDYVTNELILQNTRNANPGVAVVVRAHREEDIAKLTVRGVKNIIEPEFEAGVEMARKILKMFEFPGKEIRSYVNLARKERRY
jgi:CPA2 family monovalent cation:H+ antiporter-2